MNSKNGNDADEFMEKDGGSSPDLSSGKKGANDSYRQSFIDKADVLYHRIVAPLPSGLQAILAIIALSLYVSFRLCLFSGFRPNKGIHKKYLERESVLARKPE